jgi:hypothetical protein
MKISKRPRMTLLAQCFTFGGLFTGYWLLASGFLIP